MNPNFIRATTPPPREDRSDLDEAHAEWHGSNHVGPGEPCPSAVRLTARELEVLKLLCEGLPNKLISRTLHISAGTVKSHIGSILRALGVSSRLQAVVRARQLGLLNGSGVAKTPR